MGACIKRKISLREARAILEKYGFTLQRNNPKKMHAMMIKPFPEGRLHASVKENEKGCVINIHRDKCIGISKDKKVAIPRKVIRELKQKFKEAKETKT